MHIAYMRTWLKINVPHYDHTWIDEEVIAAFWLMPEPSISYGEWAELLAGGSEQEEVSNVTRLDPLEKLKSEGSSLFKAGIVRMGS